MSFCPLASCVQFACNRVQNYLVADLSESHMQQEVGFYGPRCNEHFLHCGYAELVGKEGAYKQEGSPLFERVDNRVDNKGKWF